MSYQRLQSSLVWPLFRGVLFMHKFFETSEKWKKLNKRLEEYDKEFGEQERQEREAQRVIIKQITDNIEEPI